MIKVEEEIFQSELFKKKYNLSKLLEHRKNYQNNIKVINIVGTNGKGSTAHYISLGLKNKFKKVGLFISPAFMFHNERIQINNTPISDDDLKKLIKKNWKDILKFELSFFEIWTLLAIEYFTNKKIDIAIFEAGIGGTLDATNVFKNQELVCLTSVGKDHTELLGSTIEKIIVEKIGIWKKVCPVFSAADNEKYLKELKYNEIKICKEYELENSYQKYNMGIAKCVLEYFNVESIKNILDSQPPLGRITRLDNILLDGSHNVDGIREILKYISNIKFECIILFASSYQKDHEEILNLITKNNNNLSICEFDHIKSWKIPEKYKKYKINNWKQFIIDNKNKNILVCGSLYFVPMVYNFLKNKEC